MSSFNGNKLTEEIISQMVPTAALIAYAGEGRLQNEHYLEIRKIDERGMMGAGMPVTYSFMEEIAGSYVEAHNGTPHGAVPACMLYCDTRKGSERYVWYDPPRVRRMFFKKSLGLENREYHVPGLVYVAGEDSLHVYAYKDNTPTGDTALYAGPFFNTTSGSVCLGSAKLKMPVNPTFEQLIGYWEKRFWLTEFSHLGGMQNPTKDNLVVVTKNAIDAPFDLNQLKSANKTIKSLLK